MIDPNGVIRNITALTSKLIELSLCNEQNFPTSAVAGTAVDVSFSGGGSYGIALKNVPYVDIYMTLLGARAYNFRMVDGALLQMSYAFRDGRLVKHRLAFFPSPDLTEFQNSPEVYESDEIYAEITLKNIVPFPVRFDFDASDDVYLELHHPRSHLTLGQYANCRIPVSAPMPPGAFVDFVLRNFYNTAHRKYCDELPNCDEWFDDTISQAEEGVIHLRLPR